MMIAPIKIIVKAAPIISTKEAVPNKPSFDFVASVFNDFLAKKAQTIRKTYRITSARSATSMNGMSGFGVQVEVLAVLACK